MPSPRLQRRICFYLSWIVLSLWPTIGTQAARAADVAEPPLSRETVAALQALLAERGYYGGKSDGIVGEVTRNAIRRYERQADLPESGRATRALLRHLRRPPATAGGQAEKPAAQAEATASAASTAPSDPVATVAGESWRFLDDNGAALTLTFRPEGLIDGTSFDEVWRWEQQGRTIRLHYANRLGRSATRTGTLMSTDAMAGSARSSRGSEWTWTAQRLR